MINKLPSNVVSFARGKTDPYLKFKDYWNHFQSINGKKGLSFQDSVSFDEKEDQMNKVLKEEILRWAGINPEIMEGLSPEVFAGHPMLAWATFAVVGQMIDAVLPETIIDSIGMYTDVRTIGYGDSAAFDVEPRDLFAVSKAGRAQRTGEMQKQYNGQVVINPVNREVSVMVSLYRVLAGKESLAKFAAKAIRSIETEITLDAYNTFNVAMEALVNTPAAQALRIAGYSQASLVQLAQKVTAWNGGAKAVVCGTQAALVNVLPDDANYRYTLDSDFVKLGYIKTAYGYDVMVFPQVANWKSEFELALDDDNIYILSPSAQKLVKLVLEGSTIAHTSGTFDRSNLTQQSTFMKSWGAGIATNALAGIITL